MTVLPIYIGKDPVIISHYTTLLDNNLTVVSDYVCGEKKIISSLGNPLFIFFEQNKIENDYPCIQYLKSKFPRAYIVLVANEVKKDHIPHYQRAGISDTISPTASKERVMNGIEFVERNQELILASSKEPKTVVGIYKTPLWKRAFDLFFSIAAIIVLSPILIITIVAIAIESKGPIIYKSKRVGSNYIIFNFFKFRSMYKDSDQKLKEFMSLNQYRDLEAQNYFDYNCGCKICLVERESAKSLRDSEEHYFVSDNNVISEKEFLREKNIKQRNNFVKYENDPRITKVGQFIRKFSIDELPQLINILKGDMSIVGNRPLPLYEAEQLTSDQYIDRFIGPCGLTGLWQVEKRGDSGKLSPEERKQLDVYYAKNYTFWLDIKIIFKTFTAFIQKENV